MDPEDLKEQNSLPLEFNPHTKSEVTEEKLPKIKNKRKRNKHKKHPPEYYEELKIAKANKQKESKWDDRFPFEASNRVSLTTSLKPVVTKRSMTLKNMKRLDSSKGSRGVIKEVKMKSEHEEKINNKFNIRKLSKFEEKQPIAIENKEPKQKEDKSVKDSEQLIAEIESLYQTCDFPISHKDLLIFLISNSTHKNTKSFIKEELEKIRTKESSCSHLNSLIHKRKECIKKVEESEIPVPQATIKEYQSATLKVMEEILRWKENWEKMIKKYYGLKHKIVLKENESNFLLEIWKGIKIKEEPSFDGNPFLIGYQSYPIHNEFIVKLRACEMLLLEEHLEE